jgi:hypothetical protein
MGLFGLRDAKAPEAQPKDIEKLFKGFTVASRPSSFGGSLCFWQLWDAQSMKGADKRTPATIFALHKPTLRYQAFSDDPDGFEAALELMRNEARALEMPFAMHPCLLRLIVPLQESRAFLAFATERVCCSLADAVLRSGFRPLVAPEIDASGFAPQLRARMPLLAFPLVRAGCASVTDALQALHSAGILHCSVGPHAVFILPSGAWRLAGLAFSRSLPTAETAALNTEVRLADVTAGSSAGTRAAWCIAPPPVLLGPGSSSRAATSADMFGLTVCFAAIFGRNCLADGPSRPEAAPVASLSLLDLAAALLLVGPAVSPTATSDAFDRLAAASSWPATLPSTLADLFRRGAHRDPSIRPSPEDVLSSPLVDSLTIVLHGVELLTIRDARGQAAFLRDTLLPALADRLVPAPTAASRVLPVLVSLLGTDSRLTPLYLAALLRAALDAIEAGAAPYTPTSLNGEPAKPVSVADDILIPALLPVIDGCVAFLKKSRNPATNLPELHSALAILKETPGLVPLFHNGPGTDVLLPLLAACLRSGVEALETHALRAVAALSPTAPPQFIEAELVPAVASLALSDASPTARANCLVCLSKVAARVSTRTLRAEVVPVLAKIAASNPPTIVARGCIGLYRALAGLPLPGTPPPSGSPKIQVPAPECASDVLPGLLRLLYACGGDMPASAAAELAEAAAALCSNVLADIETRFPPSAGTRPQPEASPEPQLLAPTVIPPPPPPKDSAARFKAMGIRVPPLAAHGAKSHLTPRAASPDWDEEPLAGALGSVAFLAPVDPSPQPSAKPPKPVKPAAPIVKPPPPVFAPPPDTEPAPRSSHKPFAVPVPVPASGSVQNSFGADADPDFTSGFASPPAAFAPAASDWPTIPVAPGGLTDSFPAFDFPSPPPVPSPPPAETSVPAPEDSFSAAFSFAPVPTPPSAPRTVAAPVDLESLLGF